MIPIAFLLISMISLVVQLLAFSRIIGLKNESPAYFGLLRTAICRVCAAILYVGLGAFAMLAPVGLETLLVFGFVQLMWQINAIADVRLRNLLR